MSARVLYKIKKILPFWLIAVALMTAAQILSAPPLPLTQASVVKNAGQPQVLGASTQDIRGAQPPSLPLPFLKQPVDTSAISAGGFLVYDTESGQDMLAKNPEQKFSIASLTKLLTALVTYQNVDLSQTATITPGDVITISPSLGLKPGDNIVFSDLFNSMLLGSANDAAKALSNHSFLGGGTEFVKNMNRVAGALGMQNSNFSNPLGFDSQNNYSTAEDLKKLVEETQKLAAFKNIGRRTEYSFISTQGNSYSVKATNKLVGLYPEIEAIKSGQTPAAKQSLISKVNKNGHSIVIIVLSSQNREKDTLDLENLVFDNFSWQ